MKCFIFIIFLIFSFFPLSVNADKFFHHEILEKYDPNTENFLRGKVKKVWILPKYKFLIADVKRRKKIYKVIIGPLWFVKKKHIHIKPGNEIIIKGSKFFTKKGELFILTRSLYIVDKDRIYHLRDENFKPCWKKKSRCF